MANEYAELQELKDARRVTSTTNDETLQRALTRASRAIDDRTGRRFYLDGTVSARVYRTSGRIVRVEWGSLFLVDDISTATGLIVETGDGTSWTTVTSYLTEPENAIVRGRAIESLYSETIDWCVTSHIRVTADWGWPAVPDSIAEATLLLANRRFTRRDSPEGVAGTGPEGAIRVSRFDSDIEDLVEPFVKPGFGS